ncbi:hypothetical protein CRM22_009901 [Opisthorchis felineus]|uniref:Uncharacterized protein n=1 Tax=Opisthorchis felineus TaxID=147828 RepID=A0A4S2L4K5_OPIFE|nr:hypothetical protein CRM22_009901 [Opisthorchis felineus]
MKNTVGIQLVLRQYYEWFSRHLSATRWILNEQKMKPTVDIFSSSQYTPDSALAKPLPLQKAYNAYFHNYYSLLEALVRLDELCNQYDSPHWSDPNASNQK